LSKRSVWAAGIRRGEDAAGPRRAWALLDPDGSGLGDPTTVRAARLPDDRAGVAGAGVWQSARMVIEVAHIHITAGLEDEFVAAYRAARSILATTPGALSVRMTRGIESPNEFILLVEWDSVDAHLQNFRATDRFVQWRAAIGPFFSSPPDTVHCFDVD
jgi:heme-degrading monooxygenase HmoA